MLLEQTRADPTPDELIATNTANRTIDPLN